MTMKRFIPTATTLALALAAACTPAGGDGEASGDGDLGCATAAAYDSIPEPSASADTDEDGLYLELYSDIDDEPANELEISLWSGLGAFATVPIAPGTYTIAGDETNYEDCGVCAVIRADYDPVSDESRQELVAQSGTVVIDSIEATMAGSLVDVVLQEVDPDTGEVVPGGCTTTISASFSAPL